MLPMFTLFPKTQAGEQKNDTFFLKTDKYTVILSIRI